MGTDYGFSRLDPDFWLIQKQTQEKGSVSNPFFSESISDFFSELGSEPPKNLDPLRKIRIHKKDLKTKYSKICISYLVLPTLFFWSGSSKT